MWHTAEIVKIFKKITNGYGYEVYQGEYETFSVK